MCFLFSGIQEWQYSFPRFPGARDSLAPGNDVYYEGLVKEKIITALYATVIINFLSTVKKMKNTVTT